MESHEHDWKKGPVVLYSPDDFVPMRVEVCKECNAICLVDEDGERNEVDEKSQADMVFKVEDGTSLRHVAREVVAEGKPDPVVDLFGKALPDEWQGRLEYLTGRFGPMSFKEKETGEEMTAKEWYERIFGD